MAVEHERQGQGEDLEAEEEARKEGEAEKRGRKEEKGGKRKKGKRKENLIQIQRLSLLLAIFYIPTISNVKYRVRELSVTKDSSKSENLCNYFTSNLM